MVILLLTVTQHLTFLYSQFQENSVWRCAQVESLIQFRSFIVLIQIFNQLYNCIPLIASLTFHQSNQQSAKGLQKSAIDNNHVSTTN